MAGDVYSAPPYVGRGGWSWYTGSAAWMHRAAIESMFGLSQRGDEIVVRAVPAARVEPGRAAPDARRQDACASLFARAGDGRARRRRRGRVGAPARRRRDACAGRRSTAPCRLLRRPAAPAGRAAATRSRRPSSPTSG